MTLAIPLQRKVNALGVLLVLVAVTWVVSVGEAGPPPVKMVVTATAYNSVHGQGQGDDHALAAWGDRLEPGMQAIAVSRDLIPLGLGHNAEVQIEGLPGVWLVKDKMNRRWKHKIDIYMGEDVQAAREWGKRKVTITFAAPEQ